MVKRFGKIFLFYCNFIKLRLFIKSENLYYQCVLYPKYLFSKMYYFFFIEMKRLKKIFSMMLFLNNSLKLL